MNEILLHKFDTAFQSFPFDKISIEDYEPTILHLLDDAQKEIEKDKDKRMIIEQLENLMLEKKNSIDIID